MKKPSVSILFGAVIAFALSVATAGARTAGKSTTAAQGERAIESLDDTAVAVETHADELWMLANDSEYSPESHALRLMALRNEINRMSREIKSLEAERDALPQWEQQAVDKTLPLLNDAAVNTERALEDFNQRKPNLW